MHGSNTLLHRHSNLLLGVIAPVALFAGFTLFFLVLVADAAGICNICQALSQGIAS